MSGEKQQQIREKLSQLAKKAVGVPSILGRVKAVNTNSCDVEDDDSGVVYEDVRYSAVDATGSITIKPKINTWVLAVKVEDDDDYVVVSVQEADAIIYKVGNTTFEQSLSKFKIENSTANLKDIIDLIIDACAVIVVTTGTPPDYTKLTQAKAKLATLLQ